MSDYYQNCAEYKEANRLIEEFFKKGKYKECFDGYYELAKKNYPLAECQIGYFYHEGLGVTKDDELAFFWTNKAALDNDRDGQCNLAWFYEEGIGTKIDLEKAKYWYKLAAKQNHDLAIEKCQEYQINME
jgi:TPR repeat protein